MMIFSIISLIISTIALLITAYNAWTARRNGENEEILRLWDHFLDYCRKLYSVKTPDAKNIEFFGLLNYLENMCFLYNHRRIPRYLRENIRSLVSDFLTITNNIAPIEQVLEAVRKRPDMYCEIARFLDENRDFINGREPQPI